jgi:O-antigen/teichoic acid export membrane protein
LDNKTFVYLSTSVTNGICLAFGVISGILTARLLGPEGRGELAIIAYFPGLIGAFFPLAVPQALTLFLAKDPGKKSEIAAAGLHISLVFGLVGAILFALVAPYTLTADKKSLGWAVAVACLASPAMVINPGMYAIQRGLHHFNAVNGFLVFSAGSMVVGLLGLWWTNAVSPLRIVLLTQGIQVLIVLLHIGLLGLPNVTRRPGWETYRTCLLKGIKFFVPVIALTFYFMSDRGILIRTTTLEQIGFYSVAFSVTFPLTLAVEAFAQIGFVEIAGINDESTSLALAARRFQMAQFVVLISAILLLPLVAPLIRFAFGERFSPAILPAYYLVGGMSLRGLAKVLESGLRARDLSLPGTLSGIVSLCLLIGLGAWLVPTRGVEGFGAALLFAEAAGLSILIVFFLKRSTVSVAELWGIRPGIFLVLSRNLAKALNPKAA